MQNKSHYLLTITLYQGKKSKASLQRYIDSASMDCLATLNSMGVKEVPLGMQVMAKIPQESIALHYYVRLSQWGDHHGSVTYVERKFTTGERKK